MLQQLFDRRDVVDKVVENHKVQQSNRVTGEQHTYKPSQDCSYFQGNSFLSRDESTILVIIDVDDFEFFIAWQMSQRYDSVCCSRQPGRPQFRF